MTVIDTCVLVYDALKPAKLSSRAKRALSSGEASASLYCADISLWEIAMLIDKDRLAVDADTRTFIKLALASRGIDVVPITPDIAEISTQLDLRGDPADRLIAATAIELGARLLTPDAHLQQCTQVDVFW